MRIASGTAIAALVLVIATSATSVTSISAAPVVIDRVLAVVSGSIITLSDVNGAIALGVVNVAGAVDPVRSGLDQLIERSLMLAEVERYAPPEPPAAEIDARVQALRARAGSGAQLQQTLAAVGVGDDRLRTIARDDLRLQNYLNQRFAATVPPSDDEVLRYYREHQGDFARDGVPQPLSAVEADVRSRLDAERRAALVDEWLRQLRLRADVLIVPR
ncbi:MAG: hypothetical protein ACM36C_16440 [Acidobacteriota bacterium]